jgi:simple sugar transport system permease protein
MLGQAFFSRQGEGKSHPILETARIDLFGEWKFTDAGRAFFSAHPVLDDIFKTPVNLGIPVRLVFALLVWYILNKTTLGYELRAVGYNKDAAEYGGIDVKRSMIVSMAIAGDSRAPRGPFRSWEVAQRVAKLAAMEGYGLRRNGGRPHRQQHGGGSVFAGLLFGALKYGGSKIQDGLRAPTEVINIMMAPSFSSYGTEARPHPPRFRGKGGPR